MSPKFIIKRILLPILVLAFAIGLSKYMLANAKKPAKKPAQERFQVAQIQSIPTQDYQILIKSQGSIQARNQTLLIPEVSGRVIWISEDFRNGNFFSKNEVLLKIDPQNYKIALSEAISAQAQAKLNHERMKTKTASYQAALKTAQSQLAQNILALQQEHERAAQAIRDWKRLGNTKEPSDLVLRKPQVVAAKADVEASKAEITNREADIKLLAIEIEAAKVAYDASKEQVRRRQLDLDRTQIKAPYTGRVLSRSVELGQNLSTNTQIGEIFSTSSVEVRLPINDLESTMIDAGSADVPSAKNSVNIISKTAHLTDTWNAQIVRTEGSIDTRSRQKFLVAKVKNPFNQKDKHFPLELGKFVNAEIFGKKLPQVQAIPRIAIKNDQIIILNSELQARKTKIEILWEAGDQVIIKQILTDKEVLCLNKISTEDRFKIRLRANKKEALPKLWQNLIEQQKTEQAPQKKEAKK